MENNIPTAKEFINNSTLGIYNSESEEDNYNTEEVIKLLLQFAKLHVKAALEKAYKESFLLCTPYDIEAWKMKLINNQDLEEHEDGFEIEIDKDSILNAYPEDLIK